MKPSEREEVLKKKIKELNERLKEFKDKFRLTFEYAYNPRLWADTKTGIIINCNKPAEKLLEKKRNEIIGQHQTSLHPPEERGYYSKLFGQICKNKKIFNDEGKIITKTGKIKPVWITATMGPIGNKQIIQGVFRDITAEKESERLLKESEEKYKTQFNEALDAMFVADAETGVIVDCNSAGCKLVERKKSEIVGKHQRILHPREEIKKGFSRTFKEHLKQPGSVLGSKVVTKTGKIRYVDIKANIIKIGGKKFLQAIFRDVTEQIKAEEKLIVLDQRLNHFFQSTSDMAFIKDNEFRYILINKNFTRFLGKNGNEVIGNTDFELMPKILAEGCRKTDMKALRNKGLVVSKEKFGKRIYETHKFPVLLEEGKIGIGGFMRDITALNECEEKYSTLIELFAESLR